MKDEEWRNEYVQRQHGLVFTGSSKFQNGMNWYFGQVLQYFDMNFLLY